MDRTGVGRRVSRVSRVSRPRSVAAARSQESAGQLSLLGCCLTGQDRAVLAFAHDHQLQGRSASQVLGRLGMSHVRYLQILTALLDRPEAADAYPELIGELRGLWSGRRLLRQRP